MLCSHCGTPLTSTSRFCRGCGLRVGDDTPVAAEGATIVVPAPDEARTVVVTPAPASTWPDPDDEPATAAVPVVPDPARFTPGSHEFRAQPTVVISAEEVRRLVTPGAPTATGTSRPADTAELEWPERWPREDTSGVTPAADLERTSLMPAFSADDTVVVAAATDPALTVVVGAAEDAAHTVVVPATVDSVHPAVVAADDDRGVTMVLPVTADPSSTVVVPAFDPACAVAGPIIVDPGGTAVFAVSAASTEPSSLEDTAPLPVLRDFDAPLAPAAAPAADQAWAPTPNHAEAAWWASSAERTAAMREPDPPAAIEPPTSPIEAPPLLEPATAPLAAEVPPPPVVPAALPPLPAAPNPPPPVAAVPPVPAPSAPPVASVAPAVVPAPVARAALGGSATKLAAWVATLAVVAALGITAARQFTSGSSTAAPEAAASATPASAAPATTAPADTAPASTAPAPAAPATTTPAAAAPAAAEATPPQAATPARPSCETERALKSMPGTGEARLQVTNKTTAPVVVHWLNLAGVREKWFEVSPGAMRSQRTPPTYRWVVARADGTCLAVISGQGSVVVE